MKYSIFLAFMLNLMLILISCDNSTSSEEEEGFKIIGKVLDKDGKAISSVDVLTNPPFEVKTTNSVGVFEFNNIAAGNYILTVKKSGYRTRSVTVIVYNNQTTEATITLEEENNENDNNIPPNTPTPKAPLNKSIGWDFQFEWECYDPDSDVLHYDLYLGKSENSLELIVEGIYENSFDYKLPLKQQLYYWKVVANDGRGGVAESAVWSLDFIGEKKLLLNLKFDADYIDSSALSQDVNRSGNVSYFKDRYGAEISSIYLFNKSFLEIYKPKQIDFSKPFTISFWVRTEVASGYTNEVNLISRDGRDSPNRSNFAILLSYRYLGAEIFNNTYGLNKLTTYTEIKPKTWSHVAFVYDGKNIFLFKNGQKIAEKPTHKPDTSDLSLLIGKRITSFDTSYFTGALDDLYIFNYPLTDVEILNLFKYNSILM